MGDIICTHCRGATTSGCYLCNPAGHPGANDLDGGLHRQALERIAELEAKLDKVRGLPKKWRNLEVKNTSLIGDNRNHVLRYCADELESALGDEE